MIDLPSPLSIFPCLVLYWDDVAVVLILLTFSYSYIRFFWYPPKPEPGYEQFFLPPQAQDGWVAKAIKTEETTRDIAAKIVKSVSRSHVM